MRRLSSIIASGIIPVIILLMFTINVSNGQSSPHGPIKIPCANCHSTESWKELAKPMKFNHTTTGFSLQGAHSNAQCIQCHTTKRFVGTPTDCFKCHTSDFAKALQPNHQLGKFSHECLSCHTMNGWKPSIFQHSKTNFQLIGSHLSVDCASCHTNDRFAGLSRECFSCHQKDFGNTTVPNHQSGQFSHECLSCHSMNAWKPATFDHNKTAFKLVGAHALIVECSSCHSNGKFKSIPSDCFSCHQQNYISTRDPNHLSGQFSHDCLMCHTNTSWKPSMFDHSKTNFQIVGAHTTVECSSCHTNGKFTGLSKDCFSCHTQDFNNVKTVSHINLSHDCLSCHTNNTWKPSTFDHNKTNFQLTGGHIAEECNSCHATVKFVGLPTDCFTCHQSDFINVKTVIHSQLSHDCLTCHSTIAWKPSTFDHNKTKFQLVGAHASVECSSCHSNGNFTTLPTDCYSCHQQDYAKSTTPNHVTSQFSHDCLTCHSTIAWQPSTFNHANTSFPLQGAHAAVVCVDCHKNGQYKGTPTVCYDCHTTDFSGTTAPSHAASQFSHDCLTCHSNVAWKPATFNHSTTAFPLTGAHATSAVVCLDCHKNGQYKGTSTDCYTCHQTNYSNTTNPAHVTANFPTACISCHTTTAWVPSTFNHALYFPIAAGDKHRPGRWTVCADCHTSPSNFKVFSCINCHEHSNKASVDKDHQGKTGYLYESNACYSCHPKGRS